MKPEQGGSFRRRLDVFVPNPKLKLWDQCREVMRFHHLAYRTERTYLDWIKRYVVFCRRTPVTVIGGERELQGVGPGDGARREPRPTGDSGWRHPRECGREEIRAFLTHLADQRRVAAATQKQALNALVYLYRQVLGIELGDFSDFHRAEPRRRMPVVLSPEECRRLFAQLEPPMLWVAQLLYGSGLRLMECLRLRVKDVDLERGQIVVRAGKGDSPREIR